MAGQLFLERYLWFDAQASQGRYPSAGKLVAHFEISAMTAQIVHGFTPIDSRKCLASVTL